MVLLLVSTGVANVTIVSLWQVIWRLVGLWGHSWDRPFLSHGDSFSSRQVQVSVCDNRTPCSIRASPKPEVAFKVPFAWLLPHWPKHTTWPSPDSKDGGINTALDEMSGRVKLQSEKCKEMGELLPPFLLIIFHITNVDVHRGCFSLFLLCTSVWTHWDA